MPYDNPLLKELGGYFRSEEPGRRERADAWVNCADYIQGVKRDWSYLEMFFRNLLLGEKNEMKSRYLLIGLTEDDKRKIRALSGMDKGREGKERENSRKSGQKKWSEKRGPSAWAFEGPSASDTERHGCDRGNQQIGDTAASFKLEGRRTSSPHRT